VVKPQPQANNRREEQHDRETMPPVVLQARSSEWKEKFSSTPHRIRVRVSPLLGVEPIVKGFWAHRQDPARIAVVD
jgi:hypothetical protein